MDLSDFLQGLIPIIVALIALIGSGKRKKRPGAPRDVDPGEGSLAGPTRGSQQTVESWLEPASAGARTAAPPPPPPASRPAGERVHPDPFSRPSAPQRPSWVDEIEREVARGEDVAGQRARTVRRVEQALEVEAPERRAPRRRAMPGGRAAAEAADAPPALPDAPGNLPAVRLGDTPSRGRSGRTPPGGLPLTRHLRDPRALRAAVIAREVLEKPIALRDRGDREPGT